MTDPELVDTPYDACLSSKYLPYPQFAERHQIDSIAARASDILAAVENYDDQGDAFLAALLRFRELPSRFFGRLGLRGALSERPRFGLSDFVLLEKNDREIAYGLAGRFWRPDFGLLKITDAEAYRRFNAPGVAKLAMWFQVSPESPDKHTLLTETRVYCPDLHSRLLFTPYWLAIRLGSGLIRRRILSAVKRNAEQVRL